MDTAPPRLAEPLRSLAIFFGIELALMVARQLVFAVGVVSWSESFELGYAVVLAAGFCALVGWVWQVRRGAPDAQAFMIAVGLGALVPILNVAQFAWHGPLYERAWLSLPQLLAALGAQLALFLALRSLYRTASVPSSPGVESAIPVVLAVKLVSALVLPMLIAATIQRFGLEARTAFRGQSYVSLGLFALLRGLLIAYVMRLVRAVESGARTDGAQTLAPIEAGSPRQGLVVGILWLTGGVVITSASFLSASGGAGGAGGAGGGRYVVAWGAIVFGIVRIVRALR